MIIPPPILGPDKTAAFPTETVWGLAAPATLAGWNTLRRIKGRAEGHAFQVSCASAELALAWAAEPELLRQLSELWPGPLTLVVQAAADVPTKLAPDGWVGLRVPAHPAAQALLQANGGRLITSSLNRSGEPTARTEAEARALGLADYVVPDGGHAPSGQASTVLRVQPGQLEVLRAGPLRAEALREHLQGHGLEELKIVGAGL
ncbi:L-threonylcarbamoyladenylate synthase [Deinococcus radiophilus]|nr:L-threonylcarbamoyladenylate synthase [Deinococcus radiophilus]UFA50465.1 L-threonylcarbamoyladenylate synthase [Deinococcus radiophilus]